MSPCWPMNSATSASTARTTNSGNSTAAAWTHRGVAEVEAESVAYTVLRAHGIDRSAQSGSYLAGWADQVVAVEQSSQLESSTGEEPASRLGIARSTLARVTSACRSILEITQPHNLGGKPAAAGMAVAYERGDLTDQ
ncbi:hypothetical protein [Arthrobacter psychrolactophilus]